MHQFLRGTLEGLGMAFVFGIVVFVGSSLYMAEEQPELELDLRAIMSCESTCVEGGCWLACESNGNFFPLPEPIQPTPQPLPAVKLIEV